ncbi:class II 3-deoxy-7-phosphoheptulonate synthase [Streptomyces sp. SM12]|uniref:class II 3-deoxy-7-phosphoheptulonate synthase n=1 Tax=Streptomyces sp. SM12 TaxID=1071602 RepID=UPI000CD5278D|nr:3-deoxy-7-phosphoheptulonate synthase class II [Streptomyces sp. SM12]
MSTSQVTGTPEATTRRRPVAAAGRPHIPPPGWTPGSWRRLPTAQQPEWPEPAAVGEVVEELTAMPPLVLHQEADALRRDLAEVAAGRAFLLQAGDCAERFASANEEDVRGRVGLILQLSVLLTFGGGLPVVKVGRMAGQYGKPRSSPTERVGGAEIPSYRGDIVNDPAVKGRTPDPDRMRRAYRHASVTMNLLRAVTQGGFAALSQLHARNLEFVRRGPAAHRYRDAAEDISWALRFMSACGAEDTGAQLAPLYTSHEALLLEYEQSLTRPGAEPGSWYDSSAHMLWAGERTRQPDGGHIEFLSGVANPVGVKVGPSSTPGEVVELCERLDPAGVPGRLTLITRLGADRVSALLPPLVRAVRDSGREVVWSCDPMHGNTVATGTGRKTRNLETVFAEIAGFFAVHRAEGTVPGGLHLELTDRDVTECLGGVQQLVEEQLPLRYESVCDPRLNAVQSVELAFRVAELLRRHHQVAT